METDSDGSTGDSTIHTSEEHQVDIQIEEKIEAYSPAVKSDDEKSLLYKITQNQAKQIADQTTQITALQKQIEKVTTQNQAKQIADQTTQITALQNEIEKVTTQVSILTSQLNPSIHLTAQATAKENSQTLTNNPTATEDETCTQDDGFAPVRR
nr:unnamed protein product [Callosobruchus chinensis]